MIQIGTIIQCGKDLTELYEVREGGVLYSEKHKDSYLGYPTDVIEEYIKNGMWRVVSTQLITYEIY